MVASRVFALLLLLILAASLPASPVAAQDRQQRQEEAEDYFKKWLTTDVKYIIRDEERSVFLKLSTPEEKEAFIEQFWYRRDYNPRTKVNEFKEEHYRRIAFANERFQSGKPGWMTDRGRVYIVQGEPDYIERHPSGGSYERKFKEGGGRTFTYPFEVWYYQHIEGMGGDIELEFVDPSFSGEYRLALRPEEKDMLLHISGAAPTIWEILQQDSGRVDRPYFNPALERDSGYLAERGYSARDTPFARYSRFAMATKAPEIKFADLREVVTANITYNDLPFEIRADFVRLSDREVLVPVTVQLQNKDLTFDFKNGVYMAKVNIYGVIKSMVNRVVAEFEDTVVAEYSPQGLDKGRLIKSLYQKVTILDAGHRYRLDVVVKDQNSRRAGVLQTGLVVPKFNRQDRLMTSSLILSKVIEDAPKDADPNERFIIGDLKIFPNVGDTFYPGEEVGAYLQVYNVELDQASQQPNVRIRYLIRKGGQVVKEVEDKGETIQYFSSRRMVLVHHLSLGDLEEGRYNFQIEVEDLIGQRKVEQKGTFNIIPSPLQQTED